MEKLTKFYKNILLTEGEQDVIDNVRIMSFSPGYHFASHFHPTVEFIVCMEGECEFCVCQTHVELTKGDYIVIFSKHPHKFDVGSMECTILQMHFYPDVFKELFSDTLRDRELYFLLDITLERKIYLAGKCSEQLYHSFWYVCKEAEKKEKHYQKLMNLYFTQILILLSRDMKEQRGDIWKNRHLISAFEYIKMNYSSKITVKELADYCGVSERRLSELFHTHLGMNISTYILYFRLNKSIELAMDQTKNYTLAELALETGFGSQQYFSKVFKDTMNITPAKYFAHFSSRIRE